MSTYKFLGIMIVYCVAAYFVIAGAGCAGSLQPAYKGGGSEPNVTERIATYPSSAGDPLWRRGVTKITTVNNPTDYPVEVEVRCLDELEKVKVGPHRSQSFFYVSNRFYMYEKFCEIEFWRRID